MRRPRRRRASRRSWTAPRRSACRPSSPSPTTSSPRAGSTEAADWDPRVYAAVALHPTRANALTEEAKTVIERLAEHPRVVAIGETGMDMYWPGRLDGCAEPAEQREAFAWHIDLAKRTGKPLMIHNRDADADVLDVLRAEGAPETVIFHCFSSDAEMARTCVDAGWLLSLVGHRQLPQRPRAARGRRADPAGAAAGRDRCAVSDPAPVSWRAERAVLPALHGAGAGRGRRAARRRLARESTATAVPGLWAGGVAVPRPVRYRLVIDAGARPSRPNRPSRG